MHQVQSANQMRKYSSFQDDLEENIREEFNKIDVHNKDTLNYQQARQLLKRLNLEKEIPFKGSYTLDEIRMLMDEKVTQVQFAGNYLYCLQSQLKCKKITIDLILPFNPIQAAKLLQNDVFEFLGACYRQKIPQDHEKYIYSEPSRLKPIDGFNITRIDNSQIHTAMHRNYYDSVARERFIECSGQSKIQNDPQQEKVSGNFAYYEKLTNEGFNSRAAAIACSNFDFGIAARSLEGHEFHPLLKALENIVFCWKDDSGDYEQFFTKGVRDYTLNTVCKNHLILPADLKSFSDVQFNKLPAGNLDHQLRLYYYSVSLQYILKHFHGLQYDDPYLQFIVNFFSMDHVTFREYICKAEIGIYDRLVLCLKYLDDKKLVEYLHSDGLQQLILYGKNGNVEKCLQDFLDSTGDIRQVAMIAVHVYLLDFPNKQNLVKFLEAYRGLLNQQLMYRERVNLERQIKNMEKLLSSLDPSRQNKESLLQQKIGEQYQYQSETYFICRVCKSQCSKQCPNCSIQQPHCSICQSAVLNNYLQCQACKHGGHRHHVIEWFHNYQICPQNDCQCLCVVI